MPIVLFVSFFWSYHQTKHASYDQIVHRVKIRSFWQIKNGFATLPSPPRCRGSASCFCFRRRGLQWHPRSFGFDGPPGRTGTQPAAVSRSVVLLWSLRNGISCIFLHILIPACICFKNLQIKHPRNTMMIFRTYRLDKMIQNMLPQFFDLNSFWQFCQCRFNWLFYISYLMT